MSVQIENGYDDDYHHQISQISATHCTASGGVRRRNLHSILCFRDRIKAIRYDGNVRPLSVHVVVDPPIHFIPISNLGRLGDQTSVRGFCGAPHWRHFAGVSL